MRQLMYSPLSQKNLYNCALTFNRKDNSQSFLRCFSWVAILKIDSNKIFHSATMLQFKKKKRILKIFPKMKLEFCTSFCFISPFLFSSLHHCTCSVILDTPGEKKEVGGKTLVFLEPVAQERQEGITVTVVTPQLLPSHCLLTPGLCMRASLLQDHSWPNTIKGAAMLGFQGGG